MTHWASNLPSHTRGVGVTILCSDYENIERKVAILQAEMRNLDERINNMVITRFKKDEIQQAMREHAKDTIKLG